MKVRDAMTSDVRIVNPQQPISDAARQMRDCDLGALPVGENDRLVGMITDRDIAVRAVAQQLGTDTPIAEVMSREVLYCFEDENLEAVAQNLGRNQVRRLPVLSRDKRLVGIVSVGDLSRHQGARAVGKTVADISTQGGPHTQGIQ
jgi:CBS domain-containing protein